MGNETGDIETPKQKRETFISKLGPEERKEFYARNARLMREKAEENRKAKIALKKQAEELQPMILAQQIMEQTSGDNFNPTVETILKLREIVQSGISLAEARQKYFRTITDKYWGKLTTMMFKDSVPNSEALGIDIIKARTDFIKASRNQIKQIEKQNVSLKKEIKLSKKDLRALRLASLETLPDTDKKILEKKENSLLSSIAGNNALYAQNLHHISKLREKILSMELEIGGAMKSMDLIGEKGAAAAINIHMTVPRPAKSDTAIDVSPKQVVSLADMLR